ncbi:calcitonin gene-related peptide type 1 receptor [Chanos chanos]|uniref:Calcitonin gene-related peptide type 1 receptor n=1 Tax=Chanos chanos TaxID=29144 RepID=A0A6J2W8N2_CHACN|nr:calcitonin gene-related peptide type 1 receptor-like [Chanos chanos]
MWTGPSPWLQFLLLLATKVCIGEDAEVMMSEVEPTATSSPVTLKKSRGEILAAQFECYLKILHEPSPKDGGTYCNRTWDGWLCWDDTPPGTAVQPCPPYYQDFDPAEKVTKICNSDGQWFRHPESNRLWSNYTQCNAYTRQKLQVALVMYYFSIVGHALSIVFLLISIFIFSYFKSLSCQRISLHKNLFCSFTINSILTIIYFSVVVSDQQAPPSNPDLSQMACKILSFLILYTNGSSYFWMLCEGIYLHTLIIVAVFVGDQQLGWYYVLGWGFPIIPAAIHSVAHQLFYNDKCWISSNTRLLYIVHGPIQVALLVNLLFLLNIVRVLITKLKVTHCSESNIYMKAVRATLILIPLLGAQFILVPLQPQGRMALAVYEVFMNILVPCQGLLVAVIFCFCNGEVQSALRRRFNQYMAQWRGRLVTADSHYNYHTNSSITESSRATSVPKTNGQSNGKRVTNGDHEKPKVLESTEI